MEVAGTEMQTVAIDHLGIVSGVCSDIKLQEKIDMRIHSNDPRRVVSPGQAVIAMILNGLGFTNRRLYLMPQFFENKPVEKLLSSNLRAKDIDDHTLGKALDEIAEYGVTKFFSEIAFSIASEQKLLGRNAHNDTTTLSVEGEYEDEDGLIKITHGFSKDHRTDLKQIIMNLVTTGHAGLPIWMNPRNGNESDVKSLQDTMEKVKAFQKEFKIGNEFRWIMDAAWYCEENVKNAGESYWISRVPEKIKEAKKLIETMDSELNWEIAEKGYKVSEQVSEYGNIAQRWILVFSEQAYKREKETFLKKLTNRQGELSKAIWHLGNEVFNCYNDAQSKLNEFSKKYEYFLITGNIEEIKKHSGKGRPSATAEAQIVGYKIVASFKENQDCIDKQLNTKGRFILATNEINIENLNGICVLNEYKEQQQVEQGFRFLKDPWFMVDSIFLKSTNRIAALMSVMGLCLMIYNLAQFRLREALVENEQTVPNQLNKPIKNPTLRWIFQIMEGISIVKFYDSNSNVVREIITNLNDLRKKIIRLFGPATQLIYGIT